MDALRKTYESLGFKNVTTYVQSGNVMFAAKPIDLNKLELMISTEIKKDFGFDVPVIVFTIEKLKQVIENNPFLKDHNKDVSSVYVTFLASKPDNYDTQTVEDKKSAVEEIFFTENAVYVYCPDGYGRTKLTNNFIEKKLKVGATTRNWKTTNELLKIANEISR
jgi:uncharacterized protein (DUF1697 family)